MLGWFNALAARASNSNRCRDAGSAAAPALRILSATSRPRRLSRARYTSPIPPEPSGLTISYGPSLLPGESSIGYGLNYTVPSQPLTHSIALQKSAPGHPRSSPSHAPESPWLPPPPPCAGSTSGDSSSRSPTSENPRRSTSGTTRHNPSPSPVAPSAQ